MSRYDLGRASDLALFAAVRAALGSRREGPCVPLDSTTRRALEAFAAMLVDESEERFQELEALRAECRLKTRAEYDREMGDMLRGNYDPSLGSRLMPLIEASRSAPEDGS